MDAFFIFAVMSNGKIIIAVDGYSSCGKSTIAKALAKALDYAFIDTGAMYRACTLFFLKNDIDWNDKDAVKVALPQINIQFKNIKGQNTTFLNNKNVEHEIRKMYISENVSPVATISAVRRAMVAQQQLMGQQKGIVMDGRDIGTVVFPNAELKLFMTADPEVRTWRRLAELQAKGYDTDFDTVKKNLLERDKIDTTRADSPLKKAADAIVIDNTHLTQAQQLNIALSLAKEKIDNLKNVAI